MVRNEVLEALNNEVFMIIKQNMFYVLTISYEHGQDQEENSK